MEEYHYLHHSYHLLNLKDSPLDTITRECSLGYLTRPFLEASNTGVYEAIPPLLPSSMEVSKNLSRALLYPNSVTTM